MPRRGEQGTKGSAEPGREALELPGAHSYRVPASGSADPLGSTLVEGQGTLELREERLVPHKDVREVGEVHISTQLEEVPAQVEVDAAREEVEVERVRVEQVVTERMAPWEEDGALVIPVYEERPVIVKQLVLLEQVRIRRVATTEKRRLQDTVRRERVVIADPQQTGRVHEQALRD